MANVTPNRTPRRAWSWVQHTVLLLGLVLVGGAVSLWGPGACAAPANQTVATPSTGQRVQHLGQTGGVVTDMAIQDDLVYVPEGEALTILRLDPERGPTVLSRISPNQGRIQGIALAGQTAFLITPIGLATVDVGDPYAPQLLSFLPGGGEAVQVAGAFAFVAARAAGLRIINVADPARLQLASLLPLPGKALAIQVDLETDLAYVAADSGGLRVIDVSAPDLPREVASLELPAGVQQLEREGEMFYLSSGDRVLALQVSQPGTLVRVGEYAPPRQARRVTVSNAIAYVADLDGGLKVFDLADVAHPRLIYAETSGAAYDVVVRGNRAYVADGRDGLRILNISNPSRPSTVAQLSLDGLAQGLDLQESTLLVAAGEAGLYLVSLDNERLPAVVGRLDTEGDARDVKAGESLAYVADGPAGLVVVSLAQPRSPERRGTLYIPGEAQALDLVGTFVYVAADDGGLQIVDAIRPAAPFFVGALNLPDGQRAVDIVVATKRAYLAVEGGEANETGLAIADVSFRNQPAILSRVSGPGAGVAVRGIECLTVGGREMMTIDARASSGPVLLGRYRPPLGAGGMDASGHSLYLTSGGPGPELTILNLADPAHPVEQHHLGSTSGGGTVITMGERIFLAAGRRGLRAFSAPAGLVEEVIYDPMDSLLRLATSADRPGHILAAGQAGWSITDIQDPRLPKPLARVQTDTPVHGFARVGDMLYVVSADSGLLVYDIADPIHPLRLGQWAGSAWLRDVLVHQGYLYLTDERVGLRVVDPSFPERPQLIQTLALPGTPDRIVPVTESLAYVLAGTAGLELVELGHPTVGVLPLGRFAADVETVQPSCAPGSSACAQPHAYTLDGRVCTIWDLADPEAAAPITSFLINGTVLLLDGSRALVGSDIGHVSVVDVGDPAEPHVLGMMGNGAAVRGLALVESVETGGKDLLIVGLETLPAASATAGEPIKGLLRLWDIADPRQPQRLGLVEAPAPFAAMGLMPAAAGSDRLVTAGESLTLFDVTDPAGLAMVADLPLPVPAQSLFLDGDLAYLGTGSGLTLVGGLAAGSPAVLVDWPLGGAVTSLVVFKGRGYLAIEENSAGARAIIVDLSDPAAPKEIASLPAPTSGAPRGLGLVGDQLWAAWDGWVSWLDISQPQVGPSQVGSLASPGVVPNDLAIVGQRAFMTDAGARLLLLDITDPAAPTVLDRLDMLDRAYSVAPTADGEIAYVADGECGVRAVAVNRQGPPFLSEVGYWQTGYALDLIAQGDTVFVADIGELMVLQFDLAGEPTLPLSPSSPQPADDAMFYPLTSDSPSQAFSQVTLSWGPAEPRCNPLVYDLYLGTENPPPLVATGLKAPTYVAHDLERRQTYFWQVVAQDRQGDSTAGPVWRFHLRTPAHPPATPTPSPPPQLAPPEQNQVWPLIGVLLAAGLVTGAWWWLGSRGER